MADEGLAAAHDRPVQAFTLLTAEEIAETVGNRVYIDQAKGMLKPIYDIDADRTFELLKWRSQDNNVKLRSLARQLGDEFCVLSNERRQPTHDG